MTAGLKICGVSTAEDARLCRSLGVDAIGINFWSRSRRFVSVAQGRAVADAVRGGPSLVGVFVHERPHRVASIATAVGLDAIQPHGDADPGPYAALGLPWVWVVREGADPSTLRVPQPAPIWVLVDAATPGFGGQGVVADWEWAAAVVGKLAPLPVWLAGGLRPGNAMEALTRVGPAGLDVASGAERAAPLAEDPRRHRDDPRPQKDAAAIEALLGVCRRAK